MKTKWSGAFFLAAVAMVLPAAGQVSFFNENFESDGNGSRYTLSDQFNDLLNDNIFDVTTDPSHPNGGGTYTGFLGSGFFAAEDTDDSKPVGLGDIQTITFENIPIAGRTNLQFDALFAAGAVPFTYDTNDFILVEARIDGGALEEVLRFESTNQFVDGFPMAEDTDGDLIGDGTHLGLGFQRFTRAITGTGASLDLVISIQADSGFESMALDDVNLLSDPVEAAVVSVARVSASPSSAPTVQWIVELDGPVTGLTTGNLHLVDLGPSITGESLLSLVDLGGGTNWLVTADTGTGNGTLKVDVVTDTNVLPGLTNLPFTNGEPIVIDKSGPGIAISAPSVSSTTSGPVSYTVTYTGASSISLANGDVSLNPSGSATGVVTVSGSGTTERTVTISSITGDGTLGISLAAGTASNAVSPAAASGPSLTFDVDNTPPLVTIGPPSLMSTDTGPVTYTVSYTGADSVTLANGDITLNATGNAIGTLNVSGAGTASRTVTISGVSGNGTLGISVGSNTASDVAGNLALAAGPSEVFHVANVETGQILLICEDFEDDGAGSRYTLSSQFNDPPTNAIFDQTTNLVHPELGTYFGQSNLGIFAVEDTDDPLGNMVDEQTLSFTIPIAGQTNLNFFGLFASGGGTNFDPDDYITVTARIDGGPPQTLLRFESTSASIDAGLAQDTDFDGVGDGVPLGLGFLPFSSPIAGEGTELVLTITIHADSGFESVAVDYLKVTADLSGSIHGIKYEDVDGDGMFDPNIDLLLPSVDFVLTGTNDLGLVVRRTTRTDAAGEFWFTGLRPGFYTVTEVLSGEFVSTTPETFTAELLPGEEWVAMPGQAMLLPGDPRVEVEVGEPLLFGNTVPGSIRGFKFEDVDGDGLYSAGSDVPLAFIPFTLTGTNGSGAPVSETAQTDANGEFWFTSLPPGNYTVTETLPTGYTATTPLSFTTNLLSRQVLVAFAGQGRLPPQGGERVEVLVGEPLVFGNTVPGSIHGFKFEDVDGDGAYNPTVDHPLAGVTFTLSGTDGQGQTINTTAVTSADGEVWFTGLLPSVNQVGPATGYTLSETVPSGFAATTPTSFSTDLSSRQELVAFPGQAMLPPPVTITNHFDDVDASSGPVTGPALASYLNQLGITVTGITPTGMVEVVDDRFGFPSTVLRALSDPNVFWHDSPNAPYSYTLNFAVPQASFSFTRVELFGATPSGLIVSPWRARAFDQDGSLLDTVSEPQLAFFGSTPAVPFTLAGPGITSVIVDRTTVNTVGGLNRMPSDAWVLDVPGDPRREVVFGRALMFGNTVPGSVHGLKFEDMDGDGAYDPLVDQPLAGVEFTLTGIDGQGNVLNQTETSDENGEFWFTELLPSVSGAGQAGGYTVTETVPPGHVATTPTSFTTNLLSRQELVGLTGQAMLGTNAPQMEVLVGPPLLFGNTVPGSIHGFKFEDMDANGVYDPAVDRPLPGVAFTLTGTDGQGNVINRVEQSGGNGEFWFTGLLPSVDGAGAGTGYTLTETVAGGYMSTTPANFSTNLFSRQELVAMAGQAMLNPDAPQAEVVVGPALMFGNARPGSIHGRKFLDINANGVLDPNEPPIAGVTIRIQGDDGYSNAVPTMVDGQYWFTNLLPGVTYTVTEEAPAGTLQTTPDPAPILLTSGWEWVADAGQHLRNGIEYEVPIYSIDPHLAFGNTVPGSIHGIKFEDVDANGGYDPGVDSLLPGVTFTLTGTNGMSNAVNLSVQTGAFGEFWFTNLLAGTYTVTELVPAGYVPTTPSSFTTPLVSGEERVAMQGQAMLPPDDPRVEVHVGRELMFGNTVPGSIHGFKFEDVDADGVYDPNIDQRLPGVPFVLFGTDGRGNSVTLDMVTDDAGEFWFTNLLAGTYFVDEIIPPRHVPTTPVTTLTLLSRQELVAMPGQAMLPPDDPRVEVHVGRELMFGNTVPGSIHGFKFEDLNGDGMYEPAVDRPLPGVAFTLTGTDGFSNVIDRVEQSDQNGEFWFTDLVAGNYTVTELLPPDFVPTTPLSFTTNLLSRQELVAIPGQAMLSPDDPRREVLLGPELMFGNTVPGSVHAFKYLDADGNGAYQPAAGDVPLGGILFELTGTDGLGRAVSNVAPSDANGAVWFTGLHPGTYTLREIVTPGWTPTTPTGATRTIQSRQELVWQDGAAQLPPEGLRTEVLVGLPYMFGNTLLNSIHGFKFEDVDANGGYDPAVDVGLADVTFVLTGTNTQGGAVQQTNVSDGAGWFGFTNLMAGTYTVSEVVPAGHVATTPTSASLSLGGGVELVALPGQAMLSPNDPRAEEVVGRSLMFGNTIPGSIHGFKFEDVDADGLYDPLVDRPLPRIDFTLSWTNGQGQLVETSGSSDANGEFWFTNLLAGSYTVREIVPSLHWPTTPVVRSLQLASREEFVAMEGQAMLDPDDPREEVVVESELMFGNTIPGSIHGFKFEDLNANGIYDPPVEQGLQGVTFTLTGNQVNQSMATDINGDFWFTNLLAGTYTVTELVPPGHVPTTPVQFTTNLLSRQKLVVETGLPRPGDPQVEVVVGEALMFGNAARGAIHGRKFEDLNANGIWDPGEPVWPGVSISISGDNGYETTTTTMDNGQYWFVDLEPGVTYTVTESAPAGSRQTTPDPAPILLGSGRIWVTDVIQANEVTRQEIDPGRIVIDSDLAFGNTVPGSIHGIKFEDVDVNGLYDTSIELRLANVAFTLTGTDGQGNPVDLNQLTDGNGEFAFTNLLPGSYTVTEIVPPGQFATTPTSFSANLFSRQELVAMDGQALLQANDPRQELLVGTPLMFGNKTSLLITCPPDLTNDCFIGTDPALTGSPIVVGGCSSNPPDATFTDSSEGFCPRVILRVWEAADDCENVVSCTQTITLVDTNPPSIECPQDLILGCLDSTNVSNTGTAVVFDLCDSNPALSHADTVSGTCPTLITRVWTAVDICQNTASCTQILTIADSTPPALECPPELTLGCLDATNVSATGTAFAFDICDNDRKPTHADTVSGSCPTIITRVWTAMDACQNTASCTQILTIADSTPPALECPPDLTLGCLDATNVSATGTALVSDVCDAEATPTHADTVSGSCPTIITRVWTAMDACENTASCTQILTIVDSTPPALECPPDLTLGCLDPTNVAATGTALASDVCDAGATLGHADTVSGSCPTIITRVWTAMDACENAASCTQILTIVDSTPPALECPPDQTLGCLDPTNVSATGTALVSDVCDAAATPIHADTVSGSCPTIITRVWTAMDACENAASCTQILTIVDSTPPALECPPDQTLGCLDPTNVSATGTALVSDVCDAEATPTHADTVSGTCPTIITRVWTAMDACQNTASCTQILTIADNTPPDLECPPDRVLACLDSTNVVDTGIPTGDDVCDPGPTVTFADTFSGTCPQIIARVWTATDACGNAATCTQSLSLVDEEPPFLQCPPDLLLGCLDSTNVVETGQPILADGCDPDPVLTFQDAMSGTCPQIITRVWTAVDACDNRISCTQTLTVADENAPVITCPPDHVLECTDSTGVGSTGAATASDTCDADPDITYAETTSGTCPQIITRTWTARDVCGNESTCTQILTIADTTPPVATCQNRSFDIPVGGTLTLVASDLLRGSDTCGPVTVALGRTTFTCEDAGQTLSVTGMVTDACDHQATCVAEVYINAPPVPNPGAPLIVCQDSGLVYLNNRPGVTPGTWSGDGIASDGVFNTDMPPGEYKATLTTIAGACSADAELMITVQGPVFAGEDLRVCRVDGLVDLSARPGVTPGGTWSGPGVNPDGLFDPAGLAPNTYELHLQVSGAACPPTATMDLTVFECTAVVGDEVWEDVNGNGQLDPGEPPLAGVRVDLLDAGGNSVGNDTSDANGEYRVVARLAASGSARGASENFRIQVDLSTTLGRLPGATGVGLKNVTDALGRGPVISLQPGDQRLDQDIGLVPRTQVSGVVWEDINNNGTPAGADLSVFGLNGYTVTLNRIEGGNTTVVDTVTSMTLAQDKGVFLFTNLLFGVYELVPEPRLFTDFPQQSTPKRRVINLSGSVPAWDETSFGVLGLPTAVELEDVSVAGGMVSWTVGWEQDVLGYYLVDAATGVAVHERLILGGESAYEVAAGPGRYLLQELSTDLSRNELTPITVYPEREALPVGDPVRVLSKADGLSFVSEPDVASYFVAGVSADPLVLDVTDPDHPVRLRGEIVEIDGGGAVYFSVPGGRTIRIE